MKILNLSLELASPFFYYTQSSVRGAITGAFVGDLALSYALNEALGGPNLSRPFSNQPHYEDLAQLPYAFSVARPAGEVNLTSIYTRNTLFLDGGPRQDVLEMAGKHLFKNLWRVRGIRPGTMFSCLFICKDDFSLPAFCTVRVGTGCEALLILRHQSQEANADQEIWLNLYSLTHVYRNVDKLNSFGGSGYHLDYVVQQYILVKGLFGRHLPALFSSIF